MPSISSLLKSAESTQKRIRQQQDAEVAYEWQLSGKTYEDLQGYSRYLDEQSKKTNDPSELLSYRKSSDGARNGYISNEIQRQSIDVLEGRTTNSQKKDSLTRLYFQAADAGNLDLAQSLNLQIDNLDLRIQQEAEAAQALAGKMAALNAKSVDDAVDQLKGFSDELNDLYKTKGVKAFTDEMGQYAKELGVEPGDFFGMHLRLAQEINSVYDSALKSDTDPDNQRKFQKAKNEFNSRDSISLPGLNGKDMKVSYQDLVDQADAARTGQSVFETHSTADGTVFSRNKKTGFVWGRDENGGYRAITVYKPNTDYTSGVYRTKVDSKGNTIYLDSTGAEVAVKGKDGNVRGLNGKSINNAAKRDYKDLLKQSGFNIVSENGDYIEIVNPKGKINGIDATVPGTDETILRLYVNPDGQLQLAGENNQFFNLDFDENTGQFKGLLKDAPNPITLLSDNFSQDFINKLDRDKLAPGTIGIVDNDLASTQLLRTAEFTRADVENKRQIAQLEVARVQAERDRAQQLLQPAAASPQLAGGISMSSPNSAAALQPVANVTLQSPKTSQVLQGNSSGTGSKVNLGPATRGREIRL